MKIRVLERKYDNKYTNVRLSGVFGLIMDIIGSFLKK